jgi:hypothetical protein
MSGSRGLLLCGVRQLNISHPVRTAVAGGGDKGAQLSSRGERRARWTHHRRLGAIGCVGATSAAGGWRDTQDGNMDRNGDGDRDGYRDEDRDGNGDLSLWAPRAYFVCSARAASKSSVSLSRIPL